MRTTAAWSILALSCTVVGACGSPPQPVGPSTPTESASAPVAPPASAPAPRAVQTTLQAVGLDPSALDRSADPCTDFYQFACGGWLARTEIPADQSGWSRGFSELEKRIEEQLRDVLVEAASGKDPEAKKLGGYWTACMDEASIEAAGLRPLEPLMARVRKVSDAKSLAVVLAELHKARVWAVFDLAAAQDFKDATRMIANLDQNGLGLPDRDYYLNDDDRSKQLRATYLGHVERMMKLSGMKPAEAKKAAEEVMALERSLAEASKTKVERRDPKTMYNKVDRAGLGKMASSFPWDEYFKALGFADIAEINVTAPKFVAQLDKLVRETKPATWRTYLRWHLVRSTSMALPKALVDESFAMEKALTGQPELKPRWKRCVDSSDMALGEQLGERFVKRHFAGESRASAQRMVHAITAAFGRALEGLGWMDGETRTRAQAKLQQMAFLIGYPDKWKTYDFEVDAKSYAGNLIAARGFETRRDLGKVGKTVDRNEWQMSPPTVNAYYDAQRNHMVFPAGILQPPFYGVGFATAVNLGGIGMVIGHELTHGFDDEGSQFDGRGNLENWWAPATQKQFEGRTGCVATQYSGYEPLSGARLDGKLTNGENIADLGGLKLAMAAFRELRKGAEPIEADGFTEEQMFFLANGQSWCTKMREEMVRMRVKTDPHSPPKFRVNGAVVNLPEFAQAFRCKQGAPMNPKDRCVVW